MDIQLWFVRLSQHECKWTHRQHSFKCSLTCLNFSPDLSFRSFIPVDDLSNSVTMNVHVPVESTTTRRTTARRNEKPFDQSPFISTKASVERPCTTLDSRENIVNARLNRKQARSSMNQYGQARHVQLSSHPSNIRSKLSRTTSMYTFRSNRMKRDIDENKQYIKRSLSSLPLERKSILSTVTVRSKNEAILVLFFFAFQVNNSSFLQHRCPTILNNKPTIHYPCIILFPLCQQAHLNIDMVFH
jgi:hypothetical protein